MRTVVAPARPDEVDARLPAGRLTMLGLQHVLVMYSGNLAVPLIVASALRLPPDEAAGLINAGLFAAGIATVLQSFGVWKLGVRLPVMMGATFLSVAPMIAMGLDPAIGLSGYFGALIVSGLLAMLLAPLMGRVLGLFPPVVCGSLITLLGVSLMPVAIDWAGGGRQVVERTVGGMTVAATNPEYGRIWSLGLAGLVLVVILLVSRFGRGIWANLAVIAGISMGTLVAVVTGRVHAPGIGAAPWVALVLPMRMARPTLNVEAIVTMSIVMVITLVESTAVFLALSDVTGRPLTREALTAGLRADGAGIAIGGLFNAFPFTSFSQNVGLVTVTGVRSRFVCVAGGAILMGLALLPKVAHAVASIPDPVLGGAGIVMFGMVAAAGVRILTAVDFHARPESLLIVAVSISLGMVPTLSPSFFQHLPGWTVPITHSGVVLGTIVAVVLNALFYGVGKADPAELRTMEEAMIDQAK